MHMDRKIKDYQGKDWLIDRMILTDLMIVQYEMDNKNSTYVYHEQQFSY